VKFYKEELIEYIFNFYDSDLDFGMFSDSVVYAPALKLKFTVAPNEQ
jgi:hypothetical protein